MTHSEVNSCETCLSNCLLCPFHGNVRVNPNFIVDLTDLRRSIIEWITRTFTIFDRELSWTVVVGTGAPTVLPSRKKFHPWHRSTWQVKPFLEPSSGPSSRTEISNKQRFRSLVTNTRWLSIRGILLLPCFITRVSVFRFTYQRLDTWDSRVSSWYKRT